MNSNFDLLLITENGSRAESMIRGRGKVDFAYSLS
jgi:hypothetical protein